MRKLFIGIIIIIALLAATIFVLTSLIPASVYKDKITEQVSAALGRDVQIAGDVKLYIFPSLAAKAETVTIANAEGFSDQAFATMDSLKANVKLMPLFKKQVEIKSFTLVNPKISLEKNKDGNVNWVFGDEVPKPAQTTPKQAQTDKGAFARDGRYTDLKLSLGKFTLDNGIINYADEQSGAHYNLTDVNMRLSMPGLDQPVNANGNMVLNDIPMDIELMLDTPEAFLNGNDAPVKLNFKSDLINVSANGRFTPSSIVTFDLDFDADIPSTTKLDTFLQQKSPYGALTETARIKGNLAFDGINMVGKGTQISLKSDIMSTDFSGDFSAGGIPSAAGELIINIKDIKKLQDTLGMAIAQLQAFNTVALITNLDTDGKVTRAKNLIIDIKGENITAHYNGEAKFDNALSLDGNFNAASPSISALLPKLGVQGLKAANIVGDLAVSGTVNGVVDALTIDNLDFKTKGGDLDAGYTGQVKLGEDMSFNGRFNASTSSLKNLAANGNIPLPYADALGSMKANGNIKGPITSLAIAEIKAVLSDGLLNLDFDGSFKTGKALGYDGFVKLDIPSLRKLAALDGIILAADTEVGQVYGPVSVAGQTKGNLVNASINGASINFDNLVGNGDFTANLSNKPNIIGNLTMQGLDLRPYQAAMYANRPKGVQPWSEDPLDLSFLKLFDGQFTLNTPNLLLNTMEMGQSTIKTTVKNGVLKSNIPNVNLYGGKGTLDMELNGTSTVPQVAMDFTLNNVNGQGLLGAVANFTKLSGNTGTTMSIKGSGRSQAEIMRSLSGKGNFELAEGIVTGVDVEKFTSNFSDISSLLQSRALPAGIGPSYNTPFNKLAGLFTVKNGVVTIGDFALTANNVLAEGAGQLDIGQQNVDFSLRPRLKDGKGIAGFGIPIKFSGNFGGVKAGLDSDLMTKIVAARAKAELQNQLTNQVGGELGGVIGGLLGTPQTNSQKTKQTQQTQKPANATQKPTTQTQDPLSGLLGDLLGDNTSDTDAKPKESEGKEQEKEEQEKQKEEDPFAKALNDLLGGN